MSEFPPQGRCHSQHQVTVRVTVRCEREYGHGGAHTATVDDVAIDPDFTYVISWWPTAPFAKEDAERLAAHIDEHGGDND